MLKKKDSNMETKRKNKIEKVVIISLMLLIITILVFFLKDIFIPLIKLEINNDKDGAIELLKSKGALGFITVSLIEALQMVVIFIPAEFIQLTSGMTYPWYLALILCDAGVILGSSIIYFIVHVFKFNGDILNKSSKIERYEKRMKNDNTILFMYMLFIMPIIPFGAICYYGANKKVPYHKYVFTCATGVLPSIATSIVMGTAVKEFIENALPLWLLIIIIISAALVLFVLLSIVLDKVFFKQNDYTAGSFFNDMFLSTLYRISRLKNKPIIINNTLKEIEGPYLMYANHHSKMDFNYIYALDKERGMAIVINAYYFRIPFFGKIGKRAGMIPKKLFTADINAIKGIMKAKNEGYPIVIFPEARLSTSGVSSEIDDSSAVLAKKLDMPLVLVNTRKAYFYKNKWRKSHFRGSWEIKVEKIIQKEEIETLSVDELHNIIKDTLTFNEFDYTDGLNIRSKKKALGLENILYMCPHCKTLYSNKTEGNKMYCTSCGKEYNILPNYHFDSKEIDNLSVYYDEIKKIEEDNIENINIDVEVNTKIFKDGVRKAVLDEGIFHLDKEGLYYKSTKSDIYFEYKVKDLKGIAYSVNEEFEMYYNNDLYYFYPKENKKICTRIALVFEILRELECK